MSQNDKDQKSLIDTINSLEYDPDLYFYLKLNPSHTWGIEPFFKPGEYVLLSILPSENIVKENDLCIVSYNEIDVIRICSRSDNPDYYIFTAGNMKIPPLALKKSECKVYKIIKHEK
ncbi:MAG: hypothetical protein LCH52_08540 [Bacteroidetes bacterium]|nr:hypothetical protein [Bacteroidota bacterium]